MDQATRQPPDSQVSRVSDEQLQRATAHLDEWIKQSQKYLVQHESVPTLGNSNLQKMRYLTLPTLPPDAAVWTYFVTDAGSDRSPIEISPRGQTATQRTLAALLAVIGLAGVAAWLTLSPLAQDLICRWPNVVGVLVGLGYWACLQPSWLGLMIAAASVLTALRSAWPGRPLPVEASTVLRASSRK
jgi:hypothetical protein